MTSDDPRQDRTADADAVLDDPRLIDAVREYQDALEAGRPPDRAEFLARHVEVAGPLGDCLDGLAMIHGIGTATEGSTVGRMTSPVALGTPELVAAPLGDFRIVREVGRGGMGVVYEAEQLSLGRRIALKVLPFALTLDPRQLQRFKNEARAAAQLHHTNIVPIYSVGCERGVHFYAMQYIEGQTLADLVAGLRREQGSPAPAAGTQAALSTVVDAGGVGHFRKVAELGVQAAEALEHAHQVGVLHRDVKPGNLLLDRAGHLWITDFGLAQLQNDVALTITGDLVGTLRYMSPEQALARRGLVDHRTDVYSLGATLYELLTLEPVFNGHDRQELLRQIAFEDPAAPRRLRATIPADLETIILKAMAKSVDERYATAQELADDLRRFLLHQPVRARRPTLRERALKWSRRHRSLVRLSVAGLVLAAVGLGVSTLLIAREQARTEAAYDRLRQEQARTEAAYTAEAQQRALADRGFQQAREMLDFFTQVSEEELADVPQARDVRRKLLQASLEYYQGFIKQRRDDPSVRKQLANSYVRVATILHEMGARADAVVSLEEALQVQKDVVRSDPEAVEEREKLSVINYNLSLLRDGRQLMLLDQRSVQKELKLNDEQVRQVATLAKKRREAFRDHREQGQDVRRAKMAELSAQEKALVRGLRPEQARRLKQLVWQHRGTAALTDPEVAAALHLTEPQKDRLRQLREDERRANHRRWPGNHRGWGGKRPPPPSPPSRNDREEAQKVLTAEQRSRWHLLLGEPFRGDIRPFPGGRPGRPPRP